MTGAKKRSFQHLIDQDGQQLLRDRLPKHWVIREYRPDYGLDYAVEVFKTVDPGDGRRPNHETLGEHFFVQLKSVDDPTVRSLDIFSRGNVEKAPERLDRHDKVATVDTYPFLLETPELVTVERMGIAVPVLLVIADLKSRRCCFVCLNDYIDKILIPLHADYRVAQHRTVHVPISNEISSEVGLVALRWYAKRPKLLAAFQRFVYQFSELQWAKEGDWEELAKYFGQRIAQYDFWDDTEMCQPIRYVGEGLKRFLREGRPRFFQRKDDELAGLSEEERAQLRKVEVFELWRLLSSLPNTHEDVWREWFLPTALGHMTSTK